MVDHVHVADLDRAPHAEVFPSDPRTVRLHLDAGEAVPAHTHPGENVVVYLVSGALELGVGDETLDLAPGDAVRFDGERAVAPRATAESVALVVLAPKS